jgi:error-prone DNA polymerase
LSSGLLTPGRTAEHAKDTLNDSDALKFMKVDVLGLGMLGCMRRAFDLLSKAKGMRLDLATIPAEDPVTYAMIRKADTVGPTRLRQ